MPLSHFRTGPLVQRIQAIDAAVDENQSSRNLCDRANDLHFVMEEAKALTDPYEKEAVRVGMLNLARKMLNILVDRQPDDGTAITIEPPVEGP